MQKQFTLDEWENSMGKLLLHPKKCESIINIAQKKCGYDTTMPICIELHPTNRCNLNCEWCIDKKIRKNNDEIPIESLLKLLNELQGKKVGITIEGGGEPTIHSKFSEFIYECNKKNIPIGLITNGTQKLEKDIINCFEFIRVSLDASTPEEYIIEKGKNCFYDVINNINHIRSNNKKIILGVSYALNRRNYKNIDNLFNLIANAKPNYIRFRNVEENVELSLNEDMMNQVKEVIDACSEKIKIKTVLTTDVQTNYTNNNDLPCVAHSLRAMIMATGDVYICSKRRHDPIVIGNINNGSFLEIWNSEYRHKVTEKLLDSKNQKGCAVCRMTKYNEFFNNLLQVKSADFI